MKLRCTRKSKYKSLSCFLGLEGSSFMGSEGGSIRV
jgi:hypothetical protein